MIEKALIGSVEVDALTMNQTLRKTEELISRGGFHQHAVVNAAKIVGASNDPLLRRSLASSDIVNADGMSIVWASRLLPGPGLPERVTGVDYMKELCSLAAVKGWSIYLLGATESVVQLVQGRLREQYPSLRIAGVRNGYWRPDEESEVVDEINKVRPDIVFLAFPSPAKEAFVENNRHLLNVRMVVGVGGTFDIIAGLTRRAPRLVQKAGLEWAWRLAQEPRRMFKRYLVGNSKFIAIVVGQWAGSRRRP